MIYIMFGTENRKIFSDKIITRMFTVSSLDGVPASPYGNDTACPYLYFP